MQKNTNSKSNHGKGKPAPSGAFTNRIREDGEIFSGEEGRETSSDTTPLASVAGSVRMRSTDSDRLVVRHQKRLAMPAHHPRTIYWKPDLLFPQVVVPNNKDYPPLPQTGAKPKRKTMATKPKPTTTTTTTTTSTTTTTDQPSKDTRFADAVKRRPTHQQLVERQSDFRKAGAAAWLALKRETSVSAHIAPKPGDLRKAMQGARIRTSAVRDIRWISRQVVQLLVDADYVSAFTRIITSLDATIVKSFKAWIPRPEAADKDKLAAILSFAAKTVTTIQRSPDVKARNFFRSLLASIGGKTLEAATAEATKIRVQTPSFSISTMETVPKESLPVKKVTDKGTCCTSSRSTI
ncbi:hypothetical protein BASA60_007234 [Batrachochytrium salamandrivorans]|nr:hypothetical protein BASA60_007234 [Batrachochytrium salamandrivorans]